MSSRVGIGELRRDARTVLNRVVAGEAIEVTDRGRPIARIVPLRPSGLDQLVFDGRASEASGDLLDVLDELGLPAPADAVIGPGRDAPSAHALER